jgi:hypothetical protein
MVFSIFNPSSYLQFLRCIQDASSSFSPWILYENNKNINDNKIVNHENNFENDDNDNINNDNNSNDDNKNINELENSPILTSGRTKRYLQQYKTSRTINENEKTNSNFDLKNIDCVFCNFPWGENIFQYFQETEKILKILGEELKIGCECSFITKEELSKEILKSCNFEIIQVIAIGKEKNEKKMKKKDFGDDVKRKETNSDYGDRANTGDCFVTFATVKR